MNDATRPGRHAMRRALIAAVAVAATLAVFALYTRPDFLKTLADQLWACF